jgi:regulator of sigma E protease
MGAWLLSAGFTLVSFALVISVVVFFHELGHLLVGKAVGVKAVRFSIGFGPKIFGIKKGETEYRLSLLPLGGYVKFAGDNPYEEVAPEDRGRGFLEQAPWKKGLIAVAGPVANFILAVVLYFVVYAAPHPAMSTRVGFVMPESPAARAGLRYGDVVQSIDGERLYDWAQLRDAIREHGGETLQMRVVRDGQERELQVVPALHEETNIVETTRQGRLGILPVPRSAEVTVVSPDSPAGHAGVKTFDVVTKLDGKPVANWEELSQTLAKEAAPVHLELLRPRAVDAPGGTLWAQDRVEAQLDAPAKPGEYGLEASDLTVFAIKPGSGAEQSGLLRGDRVLSVAGKPVLVWSDEVLEAIKGKTDAVPFVVRRDGKEVALQVTQKLHKERDEVGEMVDVPELGASPDLNAFGDAERVTVRYPLDVAAKRAVVDTGAFVRLQALGIQRMFTGHITSRAIGGPLMMADVARKAADAGWRELVATMAFISVVLGLMNLLPVPVLDGFHVLSAIIEGIRRKPLSLRFREVANVVGIALLLTLMLYAFRNDAMRKWFE